MRNRTHRLRLRIPTVLGLLLLISSGRILVTTRRRLQLKKPVSSSVLVATARNTKESFTSSTVGEVNERTRRLLDIILSTEEFLQQDEQNDSASLPPWPSYLTLYSPKNNPPPINEIPAHNNASDSPPDIVTSCIVTAYFRIPNKYSSDTYENDWIAKMLGSISDCMVIFCEEHMAEKMRAFRNGAPTTTVIVTMRLEDLPVAHYYYPSNNTSPWWWPAAMQRATSDPATSYWRHQFQLDPEQQIHRSYQLFWIWLSKSWFVSTTILLQPHLFPVGTTTRSTMPTSIHYWMWADIGSFREESNGRTQLIRHPEVLMEDAADVVAWMAHQQPNPPRDPLWNNKLQQPQHFYQSGSHGFGTATAWIQFHAAFVATLELYKGRFVGEDQCVLQSTCRLHPNLCAYVLHHQVPDNSYFGLRHVLKNGPDPTLAAPSLQLWRPPPL